MNNDFFDKNTPGTLPEKKPEFLKTGLATTSFIMSLFNVVFCGFALTFILAPLALIFGIMSIKRHQGGRGFAIAGIVISAISIIIFGAFMAFFIKIYPDMSYFITNDRAIISEYEENGTIPEEFEKYKDPKYDKYWEAFGGDFEDFFAFFIDTYKQAENIETSGKSESDEKLPDSDDGEELVVL